MSTVLLLHISMATEPKRSLSSRRGAGREATKAMPSFVRSALEGSDVPSPLAKASAANQPSTQSPSLREVEVHAGAGVQTAAVGCRAALAARPSTFVQVAMLHSANASLTSRKQDQRTAKALRHVLGQSAAHRAFANYALRMRLKTPASAIRRSKKHTGGLGQTRALVS